jgi:hypothetical protein
MKQARISHKGLLLPFFPEELWGKHILEHLSNNDQLHLRQVSIPFKLLVNSNNMHITKSIELFNALEQLNAYSDPKILLDVTV